MDLIEHARSELHRAGLADPDHLYRGQIANDVLALVRLFAEQGHSGASGALALWAFARLVRFAPLTTEPSRSSSNSATCTNTTRRRSHV